jgi:signal transduction histidine kinase
VSASHITALSIGGRSYWVCVQQDVTDKKRSEEERQELLAREQALRVEAEAASRTKDEFLAMLGHELRNPLAPIVTALTLLDGRGQLKGSRELGIITRQVAHLQRLVDDLLDVSAITRGKIKLERRRVHVRSAVDGAVELVRPLINERHQQLDVEVEPGLIVEADEARLVQIIGNLLHNAAKYTHHGGHLELTARRDGGEVVLAARDDGEGIPPQTLARLFELFEQGARGPDRSKGGLGIGLAVVRSLVRLHGGTVEGRSPGLGKGAEFLVRLPLVRDVADAAEERRAAPGAPAVADPARRVLVVDDNADAAQMLGELMQLAGHEVVVAYEGKQALELAAEDAYDVAILDIGLPGMDGYELAARLRAARAARTLIAVTGYGQERDRTMTRDAGFDRHFVKPVDTAELLEAVAMAAPAGS